MKAKLLSLLSLIVLSTGIICAAKVQIDDLYYNLNDADLTAEVAAQDANLSNNYPELAQAIIPATVSYNNNDYSVTSIGLSAFEDCSSLTIVSIPSTVTSIGAVSFSNCSSLTVLTIPNSVISIGGAAFSKCSSLTSVNIPNSVTSIEGNAFQRCIGLTSITCEAESAPSLGGDVFEGVDKSIPLYVPSESIAAYQAAEGWSEFTNIQAISDGASGIIASGTCGAEGSNLTWELSDGGLLTISGTGAMASYDYDGCSGNVNNSPWYDYKESILSVVIENGVTNIGQGAFAQCSNVTSIDIPVSVTGISNDAFVNCSELTTAPIGEGVVTIEWNAYEMCTGITSVTIPASVQTIGSWAFVHCSQSWAGCNGFIPGGNGDPGDSGGFHAPKRAKKAGDCGDITIITSYATTPPTLGQDAFNGTDVNIPVYVPSSSVAAYQAADGWSAFTNIQSIDGGGDQPYTGKVEIDGLYYNLDGSTLTAEVTSENSIDPHWSTTITTADIPASVTYNNTTYSVTSIGELAFVDCYDLTSVIIPSSITSIGESAFAYCSSLTSIDIPSSVISIGEVAFGHCSSLTTIDIPSSVTSIGVEAFSECSGLTSITCRAVNAPELGDDVFGGVDKSIPLYVPSESIEAYQAASGWSDFTNIKAIPSGGGEVQIAMAVAANQWTFICLPPLGDRQYTQDMFTYDGLTGVQWGTYNGAKRAAGQSGWETPETFNAQQGYIIYSTTAGTLRIDANEDDIRQGETADSISTPLSAYDSDQPANTGWNILGNPYNQGFPISAFAAAGIESPITVWNGTGYTTYTPGIDDYTLQPLEAFFIQKAEGGAERITFRREELERDVEGALSGYFTVGESTRVRFSQGNLQYQASTQTWRFAENQYDMIGNDNANISDSYSGWIDLFGFGTGDNPTKSISNYSDYSTFTDWGTNAISNGGNEANLWRTLTTDEWLYLFYSRTDAANLFGLGSVNGVSGLIILPDNWTTPQGASFTPSTTQGLVDTGVYFSNTNGDNFSHNTYTAEQWLVMEQSGAVFLPVTGYRWGTGMDYVGTTGYYWSTTPYNEGYVRSLYFDSNYFYPQGNHDRYLGLSVRLVR